MRPLLLLFLATPSHSVRLLSPHRVPVLKGKRLRGCPTTPSVTCQALRVTILPSPLPHVATATRRSARVQILTDFSSNPLAAVTDRAADPLSACMLVVAATLGAILSGFAVGRRTPVLVGSSSSPPRQSDGQRKEIDDSNAFLLSTRPNQIGRSSPGESSLWLNMRFVFQ